MLPLGKNKNQGCVLLSKAEGRAACLSENRAQRGRVYPQGQQRAQQVVRHRPGGRGHARALGQPHHPAAEPPGRGALLQVRCASQPKGSQCLGRELRWLRGWTSEVQFPALPDGSFLLTVTLGEAQGRDLDFVSGSWLRPWSRPSVMVI